MNRRPYTKEEALNKIYAVKGFNARGCRIYVPRCLAHCKVRLVEVENEI